MSKDLKLRNLAKKIVSGGRAAQRGWECVICGVSNRKSEPSREAMRCRGCGSTWRARAMILGLLQSLGVFNQTLLGVPSDYSIAGVGSSDDPVIERHLVQKFRYVNTYLHQYPTLDLRNVRGEYRGSCRFVICSDVLEHVPFPVEKALAGLYSLLDADGTAVISVPHVLSGPTKEFYPNLVEYEIRKGQVLWRDSDNQWFSDTNPEFHGGNGLTLTFRLWSLDGLRESLLKAGFSRVSLVSFDAERGVPPLGHGDAIVLAHRQ